MPYAIVYAIMEGMQWSVKKSHAGTKTIKSLIIIDAFDQIGNLWDCLIMADGSLRLRQ